MSVAIVIDVSSLATARAQLDRLRSFKLDDGARLLAPILEAQTRRRIMDEKTSPSGVAWKPNLEGTAILTRSGRHLHDAVAGRTAGADAIVEAHWQHAWVHQQGLTIRPKAKKRLAFTVRGRKVLARKVTIPARPFIGLSKANEEEIVEELNMMLADLAGGQA